MRRVPRRTRTRFAAVAAVFAIAALVLSGCSSWFLPPRATSTPTGEQVAADLAPYYHQVLDWTSCDGTFQCAKAIVPLDWSKPSGKRISLALIRHVAATSHPLGSLLVNPGGPGASGVDFVRDSLNYAVSDTLQANYDIVGFDPRGVGASTSIKCYSNPKTLDDYIYGITPGQIGSDQWIAATEKSVKQFGADCLKYSGALLGHVDTVSAAKDLDVLRAALGDTKLNYLGYSYGTLLGQTYANLFPKRTGRIVLDGVVDPTVGTDELSDLQAKGFEDELRAFLGECPSIKGCPFGSNVDQSISTIADLIQQLGQSPLRNSDGRELGESTMEQAIILPLYTPSNWPVLAQLFTSVMKGDPSIAFELADEYNDRDTKSGRYEDNSTEAFQAINCLDYPTNLDIPAARADAARLAQIAPGLGPLMGYGDLYCYGWPYKAVDTPGPLPAKGSAPILVVGTTGDPATPYSMAVNVAKTLQNGHLVTYHGEGHTAYNKGSSKGQLCVTNTVDDFFVHGTVPTSDPNC